MNLPPLPENEDDRLQALVKYKVLDTPSGRKSKRFGTIN